MDRMGGEMANDVTVRSPSFRTTACSMCMRISPSFSKRLLMINAELLHTLKQAGGTYKELGVHHLPRQAGRATGAKLSVILRAFRELFAYAYKWRREKQQRIQQAQMLHKP